MLFRSQFPATLKSHIQRRITKPKNCFTVPRRLAVRSDWDARTCQMLAKTCFDSYGYGVGCISIEVIEISCFLGDGKEFVAVVWVTKNDACMMANLMYKLPVIQKTFTKLLQKSNINEAANFAGFWVRPLQ